MRTFLRKFFTIPSDIFSFIGGAVFAVWVDLMREYARRDLPSHRVLLKIAACFFGAMVGFVLIGHMLKEAQEITSGQNLARDEKLANIGDRLKWLCPFFVVSLGLLAYGSYLIFWR
jgi:hypothetical protein